MSEPTHTFTFSFDLPFIRRALRRDRNEVVLKIAILYAILTPALMFGMGASSPLFFGILAVGFVGTSALLIYKFHQGGNNVFEMWQRQSPSGTIRYELDHEGYRVVMDDAQSRYAWQGILRLWCYHDVWMIEIMKRQSTFFPADAASPEIQEFIRERCRAGGAKV